MSNYYNQKFSDFASAHNAFDLQSPHLDETIELSLDSTIFFKWDPAFDSDDENQSYILHIQGGNNDTTITGWRTSEAYVNHFWRENAPYTWSV
jgi:hypothetical protein